MCILQPAHLILIDDVVLRRMSSGLAGVGMSTKCGPYCRAPKICFQPEHDRLTRLPRSSRVEHVAEIDRKKIWNRVYFYRFMAWWFLAWAMLLDWGESEPLGWFWYVTSGLLLLAAVGSAYIDRRMRTKGDDRGLIARFKAGKRGS